MIIKKTLHYFTGYVNIRVEGFYIERFINMCTGQKITLVNIKHDKNTVMYATVGISDYKKLRKIAHKTHSKISIKGKRGLPFKIHRYRRRKIFIALFFIIILTMFFLSNYIWNVDITGNSNLSYSEMLNILKDNGLSVGISKNNLDVNEVIRKVRLNRDDIAWIGITIKGTNAIVKIKETDKAPKLVDASKYCDIVADKYGLITKINVQNGTAEVKVGDIVEPGEILIKGQIEGKYTDARLVHSMGDIEAKVWYTKRKKAAFIQNIPVKTGNNEKKYSIIIKKNTINLFKTLSKFEKYDTISVEKKVMLFSNFYLPIKIIKTVNNEYKLEEKRYSKEELTNVLIDELYSELIKDIKNENSILNKSINTYEDNGYIEVELTLETIEKIGIESELNF